MTACILLHKLTGAFMNKTCQTLILSVFLGAAAVVVPAAAEPGPDGWLHEIRIGVLAHDVDGLWSNFKREDGTDYNAELVFSPSWQLWNGTVRPNVGVSINDGNDTSKLYAGALWERVWSSGLFFDIGLGAAVHDGETDEQDRPDKKELGSSVLFRVSFEAGVAIGAHHRLSLMFDHISNAYLADPNDGLDTLGLRYGYLF